MADELYTIAQTSQYLKVSEKTVYRLISSKQIIASRVGNAWRIKESDIEEYLKNNNNDPANEKEE
jgi:excisionase family DNA binding protein